MRKQTKNMVFNFTKEHQFTSEVLLKNEKLETVDQTKLLDLFVLVSRQNLSTHFHKLKFMAF